MAELDKLYTLKELESILKKSRPTLNRMCQSGAIPAFKVGSTWRVKESDIKKILHQE